MANTLGHKLLSGLLSSDNGVQEFLKMDLRPELFTEGEAEVYDYLNHHVMKFGVLPKQKTVEDEVGTKLPKADEPPAYYLEHVENRQLQRNMKLAMQDAKEKLNSDDPNAAMDIITTLVLDATLKGSRKQIINFTKEGHKILTDDYKSHLLMGDDYGIQTGWATLDGMAGGLIGGDVLAVVGRPAAGKTYKLLHMAHHAWAKQKKVPMVVSMEMKPLPLIQRIAAMHHKVPITKLKKAELTSKTWNRLKSDLSAMYEFEIPFWIIDGNLTATVEEIILMARQLKPDVVYIDGAYLLRHKNFRISRWEKITENLEGIKERLASDLNIPVIVSYQLNRQAPKKKVEKTGLEHIAGADAIGQIASLVLGLFDEENVETFSRKKVQILKGRSGEVGEFFINWIFDDYPFMDFSEVASKDENDLNFL